MFFKAMFRNVQRTPIFEGLFAVLPMVLRDRESTYLIKDDLNYLLTSRNPYLLDLF